MSRIFVPFLMILLCLAPVLSGSPSWATDSNDDPYAGGAPLTLVKGTLKLSLNEALAMGLQNNLNVEVARHQAPIRYEDFQASKGAYDPTLFNDYGYSSRAVGFASVFQGGLGEVHDRSLDGVSALRGKIPLLNAHYDLNYTSQDVQTNRAVSSLSPEYVTRLGLDLVVPLLRNLKWDQDYTRVKQLEIGYRQSTDEFRRDLMNVAQQIESAYWGLVAADERVGVAEKSLETAQALLRQTQTQYEVGVVSKVEVTEADAGVAEREFNLITARNFYHTAQDTLMDEVLGRGLTAGSELEIEPTDRPEDYLIYEIDVEQAAAKAFENRPILAIARAQIENQAIEVKFRNNQKLPQLDVSGGMGMNGLAGEANRSPQVFGALPPGFPPVLGDNYWSSNRRFFKKDNQTEWNIRGTVSIPIGNRTARHNATKAEIELRRSKTEMRRIEQQIIVEVRLAARNLHSAQEGIEAAERRRIASEEQLRAERIRLEQGESTPFDVLLREQDLVEAESQKITAIQVYRDSVVALDRQQGTILKTRNIVVDDVAPLR